jgi:hypothetical protein
MKDELLLPEKKISLTQFWKSKTNQKTTMVEEEKRETHLLTWHCVASKDQLACFHLQKKKISSSHLLQIPLHSSALFFFLSFPLKNKHTHTLLSTISHNQNQSSKKPKKNALQKIIYLLPNVKIE